MTRCVWMLVHSSSRALPAGRRSTNYICVNVSRFVLPFAGCALSHAAALAGGALTSPRNAKSATLRIHARSSTNTLTTPLGGGLSSPLNSNNVLSLPLPCTQQVESAVSRLSSQCVDEFSQAQTRRFDPHFTVCVCVPSPIQRTSTRGVL